MGLLINKRLIMAKIESTYGTDPVPVVGTDCLLVRNVSPTPLNLNYASRDLVRAFLGASDQLPTNAYAMLEFEVEMAGMKGLGVATPSLSALFKSCALAETIVASTSVAYAPVSTTFDSCTVYFNQDGVLQKITGARGSVQFSLKNNEIPVWKFRMIGRFNALTDVAQGTPVYTDFKTPVPVNNVNTTSFTLHGFATGLLESLDGDLGNNVIFRALVGGTDQILITNRAASGSIAIEMTTIAAKNWMTTVKDGTTGTFSITHGPATNRCKIDGAKVQLTNPRYNDSDGIAMLNMDMVILPNTGNDELAITFT